MKQIKIASSAKEYKRLFKEKLQTSEGNFPVQKFFIARTYHLPFLSLLLTTTALNFYKIDFTLRLILAP